MIDAHKKLDKRIQRWVFNQGWTELREIQSLAIEPILSAQTDVLISASTAAGKTEAFFLPACSSIAEQDEGIGILYVSPLKALINDQDRRLESLADLLDMQVTPWHGDSPIRRKNKLRSSPSGIVLITPESLEAQLFRNVGWVKSAFSNLKYIVIDEFHAFLGTERGHHLLSLLNRLEHLLGRLKSPIPRVALSATLGNLETVPLSLRPNKSLPCKIIKDTKSSPMLKVQVKGYVDTASSETAVPLSAEFKICEDIFEFCRGGNHLVFANSRRRTESVAARLRDFCNKIEVPNEFFPHHGSLSKELRENLESRLQKEQLPTTAICTMTLELGIDIGKVDSVIQVTAPPSVSSLRQRLGRSGRRGGSAKLRMLIAEDEITVSSGIKDKLRLQLVQSLAMIRLLIVGKWFEPADTSLYHFSTLLHQVLSTIAQWGGVRAEQLFSQLCKDGTFQKVTPAHFKSLLVHMGKAGLITQLGTGELVLGAKGEQVTGHYSFYAVFKTPEEYRIVTGSKTLGALPIDSFILVGQHIIFGGKKWKVKDIDTEKKVIYVERSKGGSPPGFIGDVMSVHDVVRQEMFKILCEGDYRILKGDQKVDFADSTARELFAESVCYFKAADLQNNPIIEQGKNIYILPWLGDKTTKTLVALLDQRGLKVGARDGVIEVENTTLSDMKAILLDFVQNSLPSGQELAKSVPGKHIEKFDEFLPDDLLSIGHAARTFDVNKLNEWITQTVFQDHQSA